MLHLTKCTALPPDSLQVSLVLLAGAEDRAVHRAGKRHYVQKEPGHRVGVSVVVRTVVVRTLEPDGHVQGVSLLTMLNSTIPSAVDHA